MLRLHRRATGVFCILILLLTTMIYRIYFIDASDYITMAANVQGKYRLDVATTRGMIYDRNMKPLVGNEFKYVAAVMPTPQAATALLEVTSEDQKPATLQRLSEGYPFATTIPDSNLYADGIDVFRIPQRFGSKTVAQYASHLIGYLGDDGSGVAGLERAYDDQLKEAGGGIGIVYQMDAAGRMMESTAVGVERTNESTTAGVVLTIDRDIQTVVQSALAAGCEKGAAVVMDVSTGEILAMASLPVFDQNDIAASLESTDAPFVNRAISGYNIGSVYKLIVASAALEYGISQSYEYECKGLVDIGGQVFRCNNNAVHGATDMQRALEVSCNCYFINLAQQIPQQQLLSTSENMGFGRSVELADGLFTQPGNMPEVAELINPAAYANLSFGQGSSMASPLQISGAISTLANSGLSVTPKLVRGFTPDGLELTDATPRYQSNRIISAKTSETIQKLMVQVVEKGSGKPAKPAIGSAGGKTSSAQTGQMVGDGDDEIEIVHAWFGGFYPADNPRYSITVMVEGGVSGEHVAAPIFKQIADGISKIN